MMMQFDELTVHATSMHSLLQVAPICELLSMASIVFFRKVVLESVDSARGRVEEYQQLRDQLGWNDEHLVVCLDARAKATLVYLSQVCAQGLAMQLRVHNV